MASRDLCQEIESDTSKDVAVYTTQIFVLKQNPRRRRTVPRFHFGFTGYTYFSRSLPWAWCSLPIASIAVQFAEFPASKTSVRSTGG